MLEIVRTILAAAKEGFNLFTNSRDNLRAESKTLIGCDLFMVYTQINDLLIIGDRIVNSVEGFANADLSHSSDLNPTPADLNPQQAEYRLLQSLIFVQLYNIEIIIDLLSRLHAELSVVSGRFQRKISSALTRKRLRLALSSLEYIEGNFKDYVSRHSEFTQEQQNLFRDYLINNQPRKQLDEIQELLEGFREALEKNFSISDILVKVRDKDRKTMRLFSGRY